MWKRVLLGMAFLGLLLALGLGLLGVKMFWPEVVQPDLRREFGASGLIVGSSTQAEMLARFGAPERSYKEHGSTVHEYPARGLLFRMEDAKGHLIWYEVWAGDFATGRGVRLGATMSEIEAAYGTPSSVTRLSGRTRMRYQFGTAYLLEFWLEQNGRLGRVVFFHA